MEVARVGSVIGRQAELEEGARLFATLGEGPTALVLRGEPGIGKSAVWEELCRRAHQHDLTVLRCRPAETEAALSFAALGDLLDCVADEQLPALPDPQRRALEVALLRAAPEAVATDWRAVGTGVRSLLSSLAARAPVVIAIDDVQWLDRPSGRVLEFALRRSPEATLGLLLTTRSGRNEAPLGLDRTLSPERLCELELGPLSPGALFQLLYSRLERRFPRPVLMRIEEASGGNPFFALEIGRELVRSGGTPAADEPLPLPPTLSALTSARIARLPAGTRIALLLGAAASTPTVELLAAALAEGAEQVVEVLAPAERAGIIDVTKGRVVFTHPLLASSVYSGASSDARRRAHRVLAAAVADPEERARHLALSASRRDERVARSLLAAARALAARGLPEEAGAMCESAARITPLRFGSARTERLLEAAGHYTSAGSFDRAREILEALVAELPPGEARGQALLHLAAASRGDFERMAELCRRVLDEPRPTSILAAQAHERLATAYFNIGEHTRSLEHARAGLALAREPRDAPLRLQLVARTGIAETWNGDVTPGLLEEAAAEEERLAIHLPFEQSPRAALGVRLAYAGRMTESRALLEAAYAQAAAAGDEVSRQSALIQLVALDFWSGEWVNGLERARASLDLDLQLGIERGVLALYAGLIATGLGQVELARELIAAGAERARGVGEHHVELLCDGASGFIELSLGNADEAARILGDVLARDVETPVPKTSRYFDDGVEALVAVGDVAKAGEYAALYERAAARSPMAAGVAKAARARGLVLAGAGDLQAAAVALRRSVELHDTAGQPFERARALLSLGMVLRRARRKRAAHDALAEAVSAFESLPAPLWTERARLELSRVGLRPAASDELTETERRVAELAASGLRNREIAARAFLTPKSVEDVLSRVYRKLGIHSRAELGARMASRAHD